MNEYEGREYELVTHLRRFKLYQGCMRPEVESLILLLAIWRRSVPKSNLSLSLPILGRLWMNSWNSIGIEKMNWLRIWGGFKIKVQIPVGRSMARRQWWKRSSYHTANHRAMKRTRYYHDSVGKGNNNDDSVVSARLRDGSCSEWYCTIRYRNSLRFFTFLSPLRLTRLPFTALSCLPLASRAVGIAIHCAVLPPSSLSGSREMGKHNKLRQRMDTQLLYWFLCRILARQR